MHTKNQFKQHNVAKPLSRYFGELQVDKNKLYFA